MGNCIVLYSIGCPKCKVLEDKLNRNKIDYQIITNKDEMIRIGITEVPVLNVNGELLGFSEANNWINKNG